MSRLVKNMPKTILKKLKFAISVIKIACLVKDKMITIALTVLPVKWMTSLAFEKILRVVLIPALLELI